MTPIVAPPLDIEHWSSTNDTGPLTMFKAMQAERSTEHWTDHSKSVGALIHWWTTVPSYDPDLEPEGLIARQDLTALSKEVLGIAAVHRIRPQVLSWDVPTAKETEKWLASGQAKTMRRALEIDNTGKWWDRCLFEGSDAKYHARTEHLVSALMADHAFVHMSNSLNVPLNQLLPMMNSTLSIGSPPSESPVLPDLC